MVNQPWFFTIVTNKITTSTDPLKKQHEFMQSNT